MLANSNKTETIMEHTESIESDISAPTSCLYGAEPTMIDVHFTPSSLNVLTNVVVNLDSEIPKSCFPSPTSSIASCMTGANPTWSIELTRISDQQDVKMLDDENDDSIARQCAKIVLRMMVRHPRETPLIDENDKWLPRGFLTQSTIKWHISVLKEMVVISPVEITPTNIIMYVCRMLEIPSISTISGRQFRCMRLSDQVDVVLVIARQFADLYWREHDDVTYEKCHTMLDQQAWCYIRAMYHAEDASCCTLM